MKFYDSCFTSVPVFGDTQLNKAIVGLLQETDSCTRNFVRAGLKQPYTEHQAQIWQAKLNGWESIRHLLIGILFLYAFVMQFQPHSKDNHTETGGSPEKDS